MPDKTEVAGASIAAGISKCWIIPRHWRTSETMIGERDGDPARKSLCIYHRKFIFIEMRQIIHRPLIGEGWPTGVWKIRRRHNQTMMAGFQRLSYRVVILTPDDSSQTAR